jgi:hypothetical protein
MEVAQEHIQWQGLVLADIKLQVLLSELVDICLLGYLIILHQLHIKQIHTKVIHMSEFGRHQILIPAENQLS